MRHACVATTFLGAAIAMGACRGQAPERATPIVGDLQGDRHGDAYAYGGGGSAVELLDGQLPVATMAGQRCLRLAITGPGGYWGLGLARAGWVRFYLDDYLPDGVLAFEVCGAQGGEQCLIGVKDSDRDGDGPDTDLKAEVSLGAYATVGTTWQAVEVPIRDLLAAQPRLELDDCICIVLDNDGAAAPATIYLRDLRFTTTSPERPIPPIKVDQLGYRPGMRKIAKISAPAAEVRVVNVATGQAVLTVQTRQVAENDAASGDSIWEADFSALTQPGQYRLEADGLEPTGAFEVRDDIYGRLFRDAARFYLLQRCGMALDAAHAEAWARPACHTADVRALTAAGRDPRDESGGWHDAGDCNKYPPWVRYPLFMMLDLYDLRAADPLLGDGALGLPESGNGIPDLLDEAMWELDWLLKMQIREGDQAGAVYDRLTEAAAPAAAHERMQEERRLLPPTAEATAVSATVWARAARTLSGLPQTEAAARRYLEAAELAYARLATDGASPEHLLTAAGPLYDATGKPEYLQAARGAFDTLVPDPADFQAADRLMWAVYDCSVAQLALSAREGDGLRDRARRLLVTTADAAVNTAARDGYSVPLWSLGHYCWSSNLHIAKMGYYALLANTFAPRPEYVSLAEDGLHYLLGRNAVDTCFVTKYGTRQTDVYSSVYGGSAEAFQPLPPGIIGGGANAFNSAGISAWPAKNYRGDPNNWTLNEVAIYYQAPLVFLSGYFAAAPAAP